jgi:hypothetical protein
VNIDENNICSIVVENCAPYDATLERDDIIGVMETEQDELVPITDDFISSVCQDIHNRFPKVKIFDLPRRRSDGDVTSKFQRKFTTGIWTSCANTRTLSALTNTTWVSPRISNTKSTSRHRIQFTEINSKFQRPTTNSSS